MLRQEGNLVAKLPDFLSTLKSDISDKNKIIRCLYRVCFSVAVITVLMNLNSKAIAAEADSDGDGLSDSYEVKIGAESYLSDTDGDGLSDKIEVGDNLDNPRDSDSDGVIDVLDYDDDNDGLPTYLESKKDSDKDGLVGYLDTDSDNDKIPDGEEAGYLNQDTNLDGIDDAFDLEREGSVDSNGDGIDDNIKLPDHNNDGKPDYLDAKFQHKMMESIVVKKKIVKPKEKNVNKPVKEKIKQVETKAEATTTEVAKTEIKETKLKPDNMIINRHTDSDNDGLSNALEKILGTNPLSRDSDGDKVSDAIEIGLDVNSPQDSDRDGIIDAIDDDDDNDGVLTKFEDLNNDSTAINDDTDNDGVPNYLDANDDGDNKLTKEEGFVLDSDGDSILDYLDKDDYIKNQSNATNTQKVSKQDEAVKEPEVVVLFDGNAAALAAEETDELLQQGSIQEASVQDKLLSSINDLQLDAKQAEADSSSTIEQAKVNVETSSPRKKPTSAWDLF